MENGSHLTASVFRPRPSLIPLCRGKKDKKVGEICPLGEFCRDSANEMQAFLCVRCSKIWKSEK